MFVTSVIANVKCGLAKPSYGLVCRSVMFKSSGAAESAGWQVEQLLSFRLHNVVVIDSRCEVNIVVTRATGQPRGHCSPVFSVCAILVTHRAISQVLWKHYLGIVVDTLAKSDDEIRLIGEIKRLSESYEPFPQTRHCDRIQGPPFDRCGITNTASRLDECRHARRVARDSHYRRWSS